MARILPIVLLATAACATAGTFRDAKLSADRASLVVTDASGRSVELPKVADQVGFQNPLISPDGHYVGWLALQPNCCTSYPVPLTLVVLGQDGSHREFRGPQALFGWCFVPKSKSVAYRQETLHGPTDKTFELRRISDGHLLSSYTQSEDLGQTASDQQELPEWAKCAAD